MDLKQIQYFCMVGKLKSFTRAAEQLHIAQPSVTYAIRKMEEELGIQLFDRIKKKTSLTKEGEILFDRMEKILRDLDQTLQEAKDYKNLLRGTVKVGVPPMIEAGLFPNIFLNFKNKHPNFQLIASEERSSLEAAAKLEMEELDLAILILPETSEALDYLTITQEEFALCTNPDHPLRQQSPVHFDQLKNEPFILLKEGSFQRQVVISRCMRQNFLPDIVFSSSQIQTIKSLVANGSGISFMMHMAVQDDPKIVIVPLEEPIRINIGLAWKRNKYLPNASTAFINFIRELYSLA